MAIMTIHDLRVVRRGTEILTGIRWDVSEKENLVILGANGSGKTTLLSCVTGYVTPSAGTIEVLGKQYGKADWRELRKEVGLVSSGIRHWIEDQQTALDVVASGRNAELNLWHPAEGALRRDARRCLRQVECASLADRPWAFLSQGERQRVLIGRALMARYRLLILDEPCAGLDPLARERFLQAIELAPNNGVVHFNFGVLLLREGQRDEAEPHLRQACEVLRPLGVPAMRKDFLVDPYQVLEARAAGAGGVELAVDRARLVGEERHQRRHQVGRHG